MNNPGSHSRGSRCGGSSPTGQSGAISPAWADVESISKTTKGRKTLCMGNISEVVRLDSQGGHGRQPAGAWAWRRCNGAYDLMLRPSWKLTVNAKRPGADRSLFRISNSLMNVTSPRENLGLRRIVENPSCISILPRPSFDPDWATPREELGRSSGIDLACQTASPGENEKKESSPSRYTRSHNAQAPLCRSTHPRTAGFSRGAPVSGFAS